MQLIDVIDAARGLLNEPLASTRTFPDNTSSFWTDSLLIVYHNLVQQELMNDIIAVDENYFITQTTLSIVNGTAEYNLPSGTIKIKRVEDIRNSSVSEEILPTTINARGGYPSVLSRDSSSTTFGGGYYLRGNQIVFENTPTFTNASAIRIHHTKLVTDVSVGTNASEIPVEHHMAIVWGLYHMCLIQQQSSPESLATASKQYEKRRADMKMQIEDRQVQRPRRVVRTYERGYL